MPKWDIDFGAYAETLGVGRMGFEAQLRLPRIGEVKRVVRLRDIKKITSLIPMSRDFLENLLRSVKTGNGDLPFEDSRFRLVGLRPTELRIGQRYVYREKYQALMESVENIFRDFMVTAGGLADLMPLTIVGLDEDNECCLAYYLPPLIEKHGDALAVMDGIHRSYIATRVGKTHMAIQIERVNVPFPCGMRSWENSKVIPLAERPADMRDRYFGMQQELFRDLKSVGIDG